MTARIPSGIAVRSVSSSARSSQWVPLAADGWRRRRTAAAATAEESRVSIRKMLANGRPFALTSNPSHKEWAEPLGFGGSAAAWTAV